MRLPAYRIGCPIGTAQYKNRVCFDCENGPYVLLRNCAESLPKSFIYLLRHRISNSLRTLDGYIAQTQYQKTLLSQFLTNISVINNYYEPCLMFRQRIPIGLKTHFLVGRASKEKDLIRLQNSRKLIQKKAFIFWDNGRISFKKFTDNLKYHGFISATELELVNQIQFLIVPSRWSEGFPNVLLQGIAAGVIPIVSNIGSLAELGSKFKCVLVDPYEEDSFSGR